MSLRIVGAGLPRTGTKSLRKALESLIGGRCYHGLELVERPEHIQIWREALRGEHPSWRELLADYSAIVDWPGSAFVPELTQAHPDTIVILSTRRSAVEWWRSFDRAILQLVRDEEPPEPSRLLAVFRDMGYARTALRTLRLGGAFALSELVTNGRELNRELVNTRLTTDWRESAGTAAYERHNEWIRTVVPPERLVEWRPEDGWDPLCRALRVPVPAAPFPHL